MTLSSMTGFGRAEGVFGDWTWAVEARSVNGRNLEVRFRAPTGFDTLERAAREAAQGRFQRGQIAINIQGRQSESRGVTRINFQAVERYLAQCEPLLATGRVVAPSLDGLLSLPGVIEAVAADDTPERRAALEAAMAASILSALLALDLARREEGAALSKVLSGFLDGIQCLMTAATGEAEAQPAAIRDRFARRLTELAGDAASPERILQEAAAMSLKADVREELDRLIGHVAAARGLLAQAGGSGRRLDFLTQEFMREANTLCSKAATASLTTVGLELKAIIDQFREQVQNVE